MKNEKADKISSLGGFLAVWIIVTIVLMVMFRLSGFHIKYPLSNTGHDDTLSLIHI